VCGRNPKVVGILRIPSTPNVGLGNRLSVLLPDLCLDRGAARYALSTGGDKTTIKPSSHKLDNYFIIKSMRSVHEVGHVQAYDKFQGANGR